MILFILLNIVSFVRTIFIIAIIYYAIKLFSRLVLPSLVQKGVKNMQQKMYEQQRQQQRSGKREGEVTIENNRNNQQKSTRDSGVYVDFEEVD